MSTTIHAATQNAVSASFSAEEKRAYAVGIALELVAAKLSSGASTNLEGEVESLSKYADQIQEALKVK
ncbi:hypothetical protein F3H16_31565 [Pseudomonas aeruginosa]|uniref:hypothetical protein n=1 Tax=Pseudomonas aeruginosa TaxID=287 RepID=UPI000A7463F0|nr:hypothetical protein [Pseudomonas aeruginosa]EJH4830412.1 hypothetical protein [Pseudomonas aeruginosa]EKX5105832.1 hypothetical protein [Pseudomonas aeruginosa]EMF0829288.1 hypothetical protein [Pseudomonas aeruginosa]KAA5614813.1 hypothetical protein F3H15_31585 [Pseudomonas aeruginosa]KAA5635708.1 hypothetical protein F3H16_31565 [Pseudomonas aeruginosa]